VALVVEAGWLLSPIKAADLDGPTGLVSLR
jgi:hypothetical protein